MADPLSLTVDPPLGERPRGRSARVRDAVLDATVDVVAASGYEAMTIDEVAARAGVHKTSIYRRWGSKERLVVDAMHARSDAMIEMPDTGRLDRDVLAFLRAVAAHVTSPLGRALLLATMPSEDEIASRESPRARFWRERFARATDRLDRARDDGELPADIDTSLLVEALIGPIHFRALVSGVPIDDAFLTTVMSLVGIPEPGR